MSYEVLARKWRPRRFSDLIGQDHVVKALKGALRSRNIGHAYLFTGTRGVGKTSLARILAKALNCENLNEMQEPCLECRNCLAIDEGNSLNYQEVDGASHNGVEHIRSLIENLQYLPTQGRYKLYVIDEVHMLSTSAFNALLKTLEEPPAHVIFIFATTDPDKLLKTVVSRCQRFDLRAISLIVLKDHIAKILNKEGIKVESEQVLSLICQAGKGSVRDTLTLIEQLRNFSEGRSITEESLFYGLGLTKLSAIEEICEAVINTDIKKLTATYKACLRENIDIANFANQLLDCFYEMVQSQLEENAVTVGRYIQIYEGLSKDFQWSLKSLNPERTVLVSLQKYALEKNMAVKKSPPIKKEARKPAPSQRTEKISQVTGRAQISSIAEKGFSFAGFLSYLRGKKPASAANLELGNVISSEVEGEEASVLFGFTEESKLFFDYFQEKDVLKGLRQELSNFLRKDFEKVKVSFKIVGKEEAEKSSFKSVAEIEGLKKDKNAADLKKNFRDQGMIKEAEKIFGKAIEDIQLKGQ